MGLLGVALSLYRVNVLALSYIGTLCPLTCAGFATQKLCGVASRQLACRFLMPVPHVLYLRLMAKCGRGNVDTLDTC
ncbi:hypothetical protein BR93DRAFT_274299 [Coniochaeta sp. PMI_546]|nr:hypothetical protein BR93DRAFT_274299 [Coniochaeta sp. PMI_546]